MYIFASDLRRIGKIINFTRNTQYGELQLEMTEETLSFLSSRSIEGKRKEEEEEKKAERSTTEANNKSKNIGWFSLGVSASEICSIPKFLEI